MKLSLPVYICDSMQAKIYFEANFFSIKAVLFDKFNNGK